jgi:hypothetical protein
VKGPSPMGIGRGIRTQRGTEDRKDTHCIEQVSTTTVRN